MINLIKKYWWAIAGVLLFGYLFTVQEKAVKKNNPDDTIKTAPEPTVIKPGVGYTSYTGAQDIRLTAEEQTEDEAVKKLMDKVPVITEDFTIEIDYKKFIFKVIFKDPSKSENIDKFYKWREENGYDKISLKYFEIEK
ncbi:MAG: hypothetical protein WC686_05455 [Candidatus Shapirobacteria bacterium]|jgi:hypothetical protein